MFSPGSGVLEEIFDVLDKIRSGLHVENTEDVRVSVQSLGTFAFEQRGLHLGEVTHGPALSLDSTNGQIFKDSRSFLRQVL